MKKLILLLVVLISISMPLFAGGHKEKVGKQQDMQGKESQAKIVEIATFQIKEGTTVEEFAMIDKALEVEYIIKQPGFIARHSGANEKGEWVAIIYWASAEDADASIASFADAPATGPFMSNMDTSTMSANRYTIQK